MIINSKSDLDLAPAEVRVAFLEGLASSIYNWQWIDGQWVLTTNTTALEQFGFVVADFPDAAQPAQPDYNPDQQEAQRKVEEAESNRRAAYALESDPLFFKAQRGEATLQEWQDKVAEIKARYPKETV